MYQRKVEFMQGDITLYLGDCLEVMPTLEENSIDLTLCDLPYGTTRNKWDNVLPLDKLWKEYKRVNKKNAAIVLTAQTPFDKVLGASNLEMLKYEWIWEKSIATGFVHAKRMPMKAHENVLLFYKKVPTYNPQMEEGKPYTDKPRKRTLQVFGENIAPVAIKSEIVNEGTRYPRSVLKIANPNNKTIHPTQKPVPLMEYFIKTYSNENDWVLDNTMGSGTTGVACINTGRKFIGIEKEEKYFDIAVERMKGAL